MTVKCFLLLSSLGLVLTAQAQDCGSPPLQPNMNLRDSDYSLTQFPDGTRVGYTCAIGYISAGGSPTIVCTSGTWSSLALKCERKNCGSAGEVLNGEVQYPQEGTEFGDSAVVVCNTGFRLVGRSTLNCGDKGWMGRLPECEVVSCDPPDPIEGGTYRDVKDSYEYREVIRYTCQKDLTLMGSSTLTCSEDGVFTPDPPTCSRHECDKPNIDNAQRLGGYKPTYKYKDTVRHQCNSGYKMIGESTSVCELDGWTPKLMTCEETDEEGTGGEGGTDKEGTDGEEGNSGNNTGRNVGIGVGATAGCAAAAGGGMYYKKKKKEGFQKGTRENGTEEDEGEPVQLDSKHSSPVCPTLLDVKTSA
ncbi:regulator of complement activation group 2 gene 1 isoform X5 [Halichoeres trimaculatus]|uniref:regulator of complement activation group 2 gene 1 isoform X5 n=1 Tax=Halichoeres trimaculatus TaxID=147232 RepID=UPI003D9E38EF